MNEPKFGKCSTCVWLKWPDEPLTPNSIGICSYFHLIRRCHQDCNGEYSQVEKAWIDKAEREDKEKNKLELIACGG